MSVATQKIQRTTGMQLFSPRIPNKTVKVESYPWT